MAVKTAIGSPDEDPKKKKYGSVPDGKKKYTEKPDPNQKRRDMMMNKESMNKDKKKRMIDRAKDMPQYNPKPKSPHEPSSHPKPKGTDNRQWETKHQEHRNSMSAKPEPKGINVKKKQEDHISRLRDELKKKSGSVKIVKNTIKKPEDKEKENKLKKTASRPKTAIRAKNKGKK